MCYFEHFGPRNLTRVEICSTKKDRYKKSSALIINHYRGLSDWVQQHLVPRSPCHWFLRFGFKRIRYQSKTRTFFIIESTPTGAGLYAYQMVIQLETGP